jgi:putative salt-induced outer membrane protein YdiY
MTCLVRRTLFLVIPFVLMMPNRAAAQQQPATPSNEPPKQWEGSAGAGFAITGGNSETINVNLAYDVTRTPKARNVMKSTGLYLRGETDDELTVDKLALMFRDEYNVTTRVYVFGQFDYFRDTFKLIDYLVAPTGGIGFKVVNTEATKFSVDTGAGVAWEKNPGLDVKTSGAIVAGEKLTHQLTSTASIKHATTALWKTDDFADGLYTFSIGLATRISTHMQLSIDFLDVFKNRPPTSATQKNDTALVTAIAAKF